MNLRTCITTLVSMICLFGAAYADREHEPASGVRAAATESPRHLHQVRANRTQKQSPNRTTPALHER